MKVNNILWSLLIIAISVAFSIVSFLNFSGHNTHLSQDSKNSKNTSISSLVLGGNFTVEVIDSSISIGNYFRGHYKNYNYSHFQVFTFKNSLKIFFTVDLPGWKSQTSTLPIYLLTRHLII